MYAAARGFTLVEVLVVVGIGSVLAGGLFWKVGPLADRLALRSDAVEIVSELRRAQARAIADRDSARAHGVEFPADGRRYLAFVQSGTARTLVREQRLRRRVHVTYAAFGGVPNLVMFTGASLLGAPSGGGTVTLAAGGAVLCVRVLPATGRTRMADSGCP